MKKVFSLFLAFLLSTAPAAAQHVERPDALAVVNPRLDIVKQEQEIINFTNHAELFKMAIAAAQQSKDQAAFHQAVTDAAAFYIQHTKERNTPIQSAALVSLTEMVFEKYFDAADPYHAKLLRLMQEQAEKQLSYQNAKASAGELTGLYTILLAALTAQQPAQAKQTMAKLQTLLGFDIDNDTKKLTIAVYAFQAALTLQGTEGVYALLTSFHNAKTKNSSFYRPMRQYDSADFRIYIEAVDVIAAAGDKAKPVLWRLAHSSPISLASQTHAAAELAYLSLNAQEQKANSLLIQKLFCAQTKNYEAYKAQLYRSAVLPSARAGDTLLARLGYAYGRGRAPEYIKSPEDKTCYPFVPQGVPSDVQADQFLKDHTVDMALLFLPVSGGFLKTAGGWLLKGVGAKTLTNAAKITFKYKGKRTAYALLTRTGVPPKQALSTLYKWGARPSYAQARLSGQSYVIKDLNKHLIQLDTKALPAYPQVQSAQRMYRGMALDQNKVQNIMNEGLRLQDVSVNNNALLHVYGQGRGSAAFAHHKTICFTNTAQQAAQYAIMRRTADKTLPVVTEVTGLYNTNLLMHSANVPASQIKRVSALLNINSKPTWGLLESAPGGFKFTPYLP